MQDYIPHGAADGVCFTDDVAGWSFQRREAIRTLSGAAAGYQPHAELWMRTGRFVLKDGDFLAVFHPGRIDTYAWAGYVFFERYERIIDGRGCARVVAFPGGVSPLEWTAFFKGMFAAQFFRPI